MRPLTFEERLVMKASALRNFMPFAATVASVGTLYFILSILSWFDCLNIGVAYFMLLVGMPALAVGGIILSTHLYDWYVEVQAELHAREAGEFYERALLENHSRHYLYHLLLAAAMLKILTHMAERESLLAFWLTCVALTAVFATGCFVMFKVFQVCCQMESQLVETLSAEEWARPALSSRLIDTRKPR